jgi:hypothetical protein
LMRDMERLLMIELQPYGKGLRAGALARSCVEAFIECRSFCTERSPFFPAETIRSRMTQPLDPSELETAILAVYRGPLEEFVSRRDALVKQLRAAKRREEADRVKALRKPSRTAWVLDNIVHEDPASIEQLVAAINAGQTVQSAADVRLAVETVRTAVRAVAAAGARVAIRAGQPIEANALVTAVHAVLGDASAFSELRAGRLVEVPEGGGLDLLTAMATIAPSPSQSSSSSSSIAPHSPEPTRAAPVTKPADEAEREAQQREAERAIAARADLRRAETALADAREQSEHAEQSIRSVQAQLDAAERALLHAQAEAQARRAELERARRDAQAAAARVRDAERVVAASRARIPDRSEG